MKKQKVLIAVHQMNLGGVQKSLISALNVIDYSKNDVTLYIRKNRTGLLSQVNSGVSDIIINLDPTKYYRKPFAVWLQMAAKLSGSKSARQRLIDYIVSEQMKYEKSHYFSDDTEYDVAVSYIQSYTAKFVAENVKAKRKVMFYHGSTDEFHKVNERAMKDFQRIYCVSKGARKALNSFYSQYSDKIDCIENYVDPEQIRREAEKYVPDYPDDKVIICTCGRITAVKGFDLAVGASEILRNNGLKFRWFFVGDGVDRKKIEALISEKHLNDYIKITGLKDNPYPYIKHCDVYVQPSYEESYSLSIIEAQILNRPVVSTATIGGMNAVNDGENGIIAEISAESLAEKIRRLAEDKQRRESIVYRLSKSDYQKKYERFCRQWAELLEDNT